MPGVAPPSSIGILVMLSEQYAADASLGQQVFGTAQLGDARRTARLVKTFDQMHKHPGGTLPDKLAQPADLRAFYRLCDAEEVTHAAILDAAQAHTLARIEAHAGVVVILHDTTELDYTSLTSLAGELGQIGDGHGRGYLCHNSLAVTPSGEVLGLVNQVLHQRDQVPDDETLAAHRDRETRESLLWLEGTHPLPAERRLIDVSDQGSDTFEFLEHQFKSGRRFVIRAYKARKVTLGHAGPSASYSLPAAGQQLPELGRFTMDVQVQKGRKARQDAEFIVRGGAVLVAPPHARYGHHGNAALPLYLVQVTEVAPPPGAKAITWTLLTNEPVSQLADAERVIGWYKLRWIIEELHKAQKTGCGIEDLQFCTTERLEPAIALLSVVATTLLDLRDAARRDDAKTRRADEVIARDYSIVLSRWRYKRVRTDLTVHEFFMALGRLGGHQNRKGDGLPGWLVLWRGWTKLQAMLDGYDAAHDFLNEKW